jgi:hypothetical protein
MVGIDFGHRDSPPVFYSLNELNYDTKVPRNFESSMFHPRKVRILLSTMPPGRQSTTIGDGPFSTIKTKRPECSGTAMTMAVPGNPANLGTSKNNDLLCQGTQVP